MNSEESALESALERAGRYRKYYRDRHRAVVDEVDALVLKARSLGWEMSRIEKILGIKKGAGRDLLLKARRKFDDGNLDKHFPG